MTMTALITMIIVLGGIWGGFAYALYRAMQIEKNKA
ncbi:MAG TPA: MetS family NSS transporter small subunit [Bacteroidetes bacterium]|nr:MetS family NSS transporter small subunit [Bacteroidota bacterium]